MAVYTQISEDDLKNLLLSYDIGNLVRFEGIEQGVSNTNYHVFTDEGRYILTLFEPHRVHADDIPHFVNYAVVLEQNGVPAPATMPRKDGAFISELYARPAAIYSFLQGEGGHAGMITPAICEKAGEVLAKMHKAAEHITDTAKNHFGQERWQEWLSSIGADMNEIDPALHDLTKDELLWIMDVLPSDLPSGAIHADYFPDNVFFKDGDVTGVIDFHFVCHDSFAYDLAIAVNAWCFDQDNEFSMDRMQAMMLGYNRIRPLSQAERAALPVLLRAASLRFLLSRIEEKLAWTADKMMVPHDPMVFEKRLRHFQRMYP